MNATARRLVAIAVALAFSAQTTGAASLGAALTHAPGAFPPPSARQAAFPPRAAAKAGPRGPVGPTWLESAAVVSAYLLEQAREGAAVVASNLRDLVPIVPTKLPPGYNLISAGPAELEAPSPSGLFTAIPPARPEAPAAEIITPASSGPADRMMIAMEPGVRLDSVIGKGEVDFSSPPPPALNYGDTTLPAFHEKTITQNGVKARLTYLHPHGSVVGGPTGYTATFASGRKTFAAGNLPEAFRREFPIYWHGEQVEIEMTIENATDRVLRDVRLESGQETFRTVGTEGRRINRPVELDVAKTLIPGQKVTARWFVRLEGPGHAAVNLEQTHVTISAGAPDAAPLVDAPQAGVIDPPGPGWTILR